jgi:hypothetical protein
MRVLRNLTYILGSVRLAPRFALANISENVPTASFPRVSYKLTPTFAYAFNANSITTHSDQEPTMSEWANGTANKGFTGSVWTPKSDCGKFASTYGSVLEQCVDGATEIAPPLIYLRIRLPNIVVCVFQRILRSNRTVSQKREIFGKCVTAIENLRESGESTRCVQIDVAKNSWRK